VFCATGNYVIRHSRLGRSTLWVSGVGALFAAMSLAAMPPQAGFVSECVSPSLAILMPLLALFPAGLLLSGR
jgi:formate hydrogenlyase subunit 3/multisubunit Na+/H+ antiporter MnhD subunit